MLRLLGQSEFGIYQIVYSVVGFLALLNFGFSSSYIKFYTIAKNKDSSGLEVAKLNASFVVVFSLLSLIVLILGCLMAYNTDSVLGGKLTEDELGTAKVLMYILVINTVVQFEYVVFNNFLIANEKFIALQIITIISTILNPCFTFPMLLLGYGSIGMGVALLSISVLQLLFASIYCIRKLKIRFVFRGLVWGAFKDIGVFSFYIFLESVISLINISLDRFLLGKLVGSISAAIYAVGGQINSLYTYLSTTISSVFIPRVNRLVEDGDKNKELSDLFIRVGKIQFVVLYLILCGFIIFGQRFMKLWVGEGYDEAFVVALILIIPNTINLIQNVAYEIQRAKFLQKYRSLMWIFIAILNIIVSIFFIKKWGASGAALGTAIAWIVGSGFLMNWFYAKYVALDIKSFWAEILRLMRGGIIPLAIGAISYKLLLHCSVIVFFGSMFIFAVVYAISMYYTAFNLIEKEMVKQYISQALQKVRLR